MNTIAILSNIESVVKCPMGGGLYNIVYKASSSRPFSTETAVSKKRRAKVTYSYTAENEDELSLEPGQVVEVLNEEEEGWWRGSIGGREGVFPSNFVDPINEVEEEPLPPVPPNKSKPNTCIM